MAQARRLSEYQEAQLAQLADAGVPRGLVADAFGLSEAGVQLYLGRQGHTSPRRQIERLENAWNIVTDEGRREPGYPTEEHLARIVTRGVFRPIVDETLKQTNLAPYVAAMTGPSTDDGFVYSVLRKATAPFARDIATWSVEQSRKEGDTKRTLMDRASERIYDLVVSGDLKVQPEHFSLVEEALGTIGDREERISQLVHGYRAEPHALEDIARSFGLPRDRAEQIANKAQRKVKYLLITNPEWKAAGPLPIDVYRPAHLTER